MRLQILGALKKRVKDGDNTCALNVLSIQEKFLKKGALADPIFYKALEEIDQTDRVENKTRQSETNNTNYH